MLKVGIISDNHLDAKKREMAAHTLNAFRLFREQKVDMVIDGGDIVNSYQPEQMRLFWQMFEGVFPEEPKRPLHLWIMAGHDEANAASLEEARRTFLRETHSDSLNPTCILGGYYFLGISQGQPIGGLEERIRDAMRASGNKPVFVVTHVPASHTVIGSEMAGYDDEYLALFSKYPRIVQICGHGHSPVFIDRNIWQGSFTAINSGSLTYWKDKTIGRDSRKYQSQDALVMEIHPEHLLVRRFDAGTGQECAPAWDVPLPFSRANAPFMPEIRSREFAVPQFADADDFNYLGAFAFAFGEAFPFSAVNFYSMRLEELQKGKFTLVSLLTYYPQSAEIIGNVTGTRHLKYEFPRGMLGEGIRYRLTMAAHNVFGAMGHELSREFTARNVALAEIPFQGKLRIIYGAMGEGREIMPDDNGCFSLEGEYPECRIQMPPELEERAYIAVLEFASWPTERPSVIMAGNSTPFWGRHFLTNDTDIPLRHAFDFSHIPAPNRQIFLAEGTAGKYRLANVRFFAL